MAESSGQWDAYRLVRRMPISVEGMLVGTSATDYWTQRATLMGVVLPDQGVTQPIVQGTVFATFPGQSQVYAPAVLTHYSAPVRVAAKELFHSLLHRRHARHAADEHNLVNVAEVELGIFERALARRNAALDQVSRDLLQLGTREFDLQMLGTGSVRRDERQIEIGLHHRRKLDLGFFGSLLCIGYYVFYEWLHTLYHVPEDRWIARRGWVRRLRQLHQQHHNPALMGVGNFNITFPIWDTLRGTRLDADGTTARSRARARRVRV